MRTDDTPHFDPFSGGEGIKRQSVWRGPVDGVAANVVYAGIPILQSPPLPCNFLSSFFPCILYQDRIRHPGHLTKSPPWNGMLGYPGKEPDVITESYPLKYAGNVRSIILFFLDSILTRVGLLIVEIFDQSVVCSGEETSQGGSNPVDPVVARKGASGHGRAKGAGRVKRAAGEVNAWMR